MSTLTLIFGAGEKKQVPGGTLFLLLESVDPVNLQFNKANTTLGGAINGVKGGFKVGPFDRARAFDWVEIESATAQTIKVFVTDIAEADYNTISGNVTANIAGTVTTTGTVAATLSTGIDNGYSPLATGLVVSANPNRREIIITSLRANLSEFRIGNMNAAANRGIPLYPGDSVTLTVTAGVFAYNASAGIQFLAITEVIT